MCAHQTEGSTLKEQDTQESPLLTLNEACGYLRVSRSSLYRMIDDGLVTPIRLVDRKPLFPRMSLDALIGSKINGGDRNER